MHPFDASNFMTDFRIRAFRAIWVKANVTFDNAPPVPDLLIPLPGRLIHHFKDLINVLE